MSHRACELLVPLPVTVFRDLTEESRVRPHMTALKVTVPMEPSQVAQEAQVMGEGQQRRGRVPRGCLGTRGGAGCPAILPPGPTCASLPVLRATQDAVTVHGTGAICVLQPVALGLPGSDPPRCLKGLGLGRSQCWTLPSGKWPFY